MRKITFVLLSLLFSLLDYNVGISVTRLVYGEEVSILLSHFPLDIIYFLIIFFTELAMIKGYQTLFVRVFSALHGRFNSLFYGDTKRK
ncbi:hypothetical protein IC006_2631 [Sulfuracidifex tepidarius]|uniref:Uncharacterized protein n=1 Tax=Sulfuracidifex tepidarius TaxID=1294262 RepID=A0A510E7A7_9CREN|nr:hypothetical protein IC006_2631 [Sulfuracidifex tepidarius]BBG28090.1 hypothetical protein IC007_2645 [Sulfuracidifex tepidarius]